MSSNNRELLNRIACCIITVGWLALVQWPAKSALGQTDSASHADLIKLFHEWRKFERPPFLDGAPDYTAATFKNRMPEYKQLRARLDTMKNSDWSIPHQVDWHLVRAEMNGFDFNHRVLKPWTRDPAFYQSIWMNRSDVPAHEGPTHHAITEVWTYKFPLNEKDERELIRDLAAIPPLMKQAKLNLTGNARELWITGIRNIRQQKTNLDAIVRMAGSSASPELLRLIEDCKTATDELVQRLKDQADSKTGPSGIGKENYTWYQQNVHLVPLTWEEEVQLLKRELDRAWSSLKLEEHRNRDLPQMVAAATPAQYDDKAENAVRRFMKFLKEKEVVTVTNDMEPALRKHMGQFIPEGQRHFFWISAHYDPLPLYTHFYHWFELARMDKRPHLSPIRRGSLLYNIFDSRNEGTATGVEEMFMNAGLYDDSPRSRELVWILMAQRAARGLGSLYAHGNEMTMEEAGNIHIDWTPRGWMSAEKELLIFEQHLYLRQPGYGTSYITGKYLLERTLADYAKQMEDRGEPFKLRSFFDQLNEIDSIPISLSRWEMTGLDDEIQRLTRTDWPKPESPYIEKELDR